MPNGSKKVDGQQCVDLMPDFPGESRHEFVAKLAYQRWVGRGMPLGSPEQMASFEAYAMRVAEHEGWADEIRLIWEGYSGAYKERMTEDSPLINFVRCRLGREGNVGRRARTGQMYRDLADMLGTKFRQYFRSDATFRRKLKENYSALGLLGINKLFKDGSTTYWFEPTPSQVGLCKNAYVDSVSRWRQRQESEEQPDPNVIRE